MTVQEIILAFYDQIGNPTDLSPYTYVAEVQTYDTTSDGWVACLARINRAYKLLADWKTPQGRHVRFREHNRSFLWKNADYSTINACSAIDTAGTTLTFAGETLPDDLSRWYIKVGTKYSIIYSSTTTTITTRDAFTSSAVGETATLYKRWFPVYHTAALAAASTVPAGQYVVSPDDSRIVNFVRVVNLTLNNQEIYPATRSQLFWDLPSTITYPMQYRFTDMGLEFEFAPKDGTMFRLLVFQEPEELTDDDQIPNIPESWHELLWMIAAYLRKQQDSNMEEAQLLRRSIDYMINTRIQEHERENDETDVGVKIFY